MIAYKINIRIDDKLLSQLKESIKQSGIRKKTFLAQILSNYLKKDTRKKSVYVMSGYNKKAAYVVTVDYDLFCDIHKRAKALSCTKSDLIRFALIDHFYSYIPS